ncbi:MAG: isoprenylcysteine carboxylmethyltransferase family protein [Syntrophaceae bacterium]|nr:isoprenylcysteine carboxylmethyltransferase family protein [Syntrophaceae bacterium]
MTRIYSRLIFAVLSYIFGGISLLVFAAFLWVGNLNLVDFGWSDDQTLIFNACLSLVFFLQHSIMVRPSFKQLLSKLIPDAQHGALFSIISGIFLFIVVIFWQAASPLWETQGLVRLLLRLFFILSIIGFFWAVKSLGFFDPFGIQKIFEHYSNAKNHPVEFIVKGPYRLIRHPVYFFVLIMVWSCPDLSTDRLLFNIMWSIWIIIGAFLEEKDLINQFGDTYREYQKFVPMFLPYKGIFTGQ